MPVRPGAFQPIDKVACRSRSKFSSLSLLFIVLFLLSTSSTITSASLLPCSSQHSFGTNNRGGVIMGSSDVRQFLDLSYVAGGGDPRQTYDLFLPPMANVQPGRKWPLLVFVHGGAWRSGSKSSHHAMALHLASSVKTPVAVALIEYRLSEFTNPDPSNESKVNPPTVFHPEHQSDVQAALSQILSSTAKGSDEYELSNVILVGHSVGAYMALGVALAGERARDAASPKAREIEEWGKQARREGKEDEILPLMPPTNKEVRSAIGTYVCVDGIYSLPLLLTRYPTYSTFVYQAYARPTGLAPSSISTDPSTEAPIIPPFEKTRFLSTSPEAWPFAPLSSYPHAKLPQIKLWHSKDDQLLDQEYSQAAVDMLLQKVRDTPGAGSAGEVVQKDFGFEGKHDEMLQLPAYWDALLDVVAKAQAQV